MAQPDDVEITFDEHGDERHPSYGAVSVTRVQGNNQTLFNSEVRHQHTIMLTVSTASRKRDLHSDYIHAEEELVSIVMSPAQWGELVSSIGSSSVPVTLRRADVNGDGMPEILPRPPFDPRVERNIDELKTKLDTVFDTIKERMQELNDLEDAKAGIKERRKARQSLAAAIANAASNVAFAQTMLDEQAEKTVASIKSEIEASVLSYADRYNVSVDGLFDTPGLVGPDEAAGEIEKPHDD